LYGETFIPLDFLKNLKLFNGDRKVKNYLGMDALEIILCQDNLLNNSLKKYGQLPLWNHHWLCGTPIFASGQANYFYPPKVLLHAIFDTFTAIGLYFLLHFFFCGVSMRLLLRSIGVGEVPATIGAVLWMLCFSQMTWFRVGYGLVGGVFLPLILLFLIKGAGSWKFFYFALSGILTGVMILGTNSNFWVFGFLIIVIFFVLWTISTKQKFFKILLYFVGTCFITFLICSIQIVPFIELVKQSERAPFSLHSIIKRHWVMPVFLLTLIFPRIFGGPLDDRNYFRQIAGEGSQIGFFEYQGYIGLLPLIFALFFCWRFKNKFVLKFLWITAIFSLIWATMPQICFVISKIFPPAGLMLPGRVMYLYSFCMIILSAIGLNQIIQNQIPYKKVIARLSTWLIIIGLAGLAGLFILLLSRNFDIPKISKLAGWVNITNPVFFLPFALMLGLAVVFVTFRKTGKILWLIAPTCIFVIIDLLPPFVIYNPTYKTRFLQEENTDIKFLKENTEGYRITEFCYERCWWQRPLYNYMSLFGILSPQGHEGVHLKRYGEFIAKTCGKSSQRIVEVKNVPSKIHDMLGVKYFVLDKEIEDAPANLKLVKKDKTFIYENKNVMPIAKIVYDYKVLKGKRHITFMKDKGFAPRKIVILEQNPQRKIFNEGSYFLILKQYTPNEVIYQIENSEDGIFVWMQTFYNGWRCFVNNKESKILRANYTFTAVEVPRGKTMIKFVFDPVSLKIGIALTFFGFILFCAVFLQFVVSGLKQRTP
jgi:hypothetical protein